MIQLLDIRGAHSTRGAEIAGLAQFSCQNLIIHVYRFCYLIVLPVAAHYIVVYVDVDL